MKRPNEMMNPISKPTFSTSAVEKRAGKKSGNFPFQTSLLLNPAGHRQKQRQDKNRRQKSNKEEC